MNKDSLYQFLDTKQVQYEDIANQIWARPELAFEEHFASGLQKKYLKDQGFTIKEVPGVETSFIAEYGQGSPIIGILGEYDALPNMSQKSWCAKKEPDETMKDGHACGHNLIGTAGVAACCGLKEYLVENKKAGTIRYYGCPAEEGGGGKLFMLDQGVFDDLDTALIWHPQDITGVSKKQFYSASLKLDVIFHGGFTGQSLAARNMGGSALSAVELMGTGLQYLREYIWDFYRLHYAIVEGGERSNLIPESTKMNCTIRTKKKEQLAQIRKRVEDVAKGAAIMAGTQYTIVDKNTYYQDLENSVLVDLLEKNMRELGSVPFDDEEFAYLEELSKTLTPQIQKRTTDFYEIGPEDIKCGMHTGIINKDDLIYLPSDDAGNVSFLAPFGTFYVVLPPIGMPMHCWQLTSISGTSIGIKSMMYAAKVMAATAFDLFEDTDLVSAAKSEFKERTKGEGKS